MQAEHLFQRKATQVLLLLQRMDRILTECRAKVAREALRVTTPFGIRLIYHLAPLACLPTRKGCRRICTAKPRIWADPVGRLKLMACLPWGVTAACHPQPLIRMVECRDRRLTEGHLRNSHLKQLGSLVFLVVMVVRQRRRLLMVNGTVVHKSKRDLMQVPGGGKGMVLRRGTSIKASIQAGDSKCSSTNSNSNSTSTCHSSNLASRKAADLGVREDSISHSN